MYEGHLHSNTHAWTGSDTEICALDGGCSVSADGRCAGSRRSLAGLVREAGDAGYRSVEEGKRSQQKGIQQEVVKQEGQIPG